MTHAAWLWLPLFVATCVVLGFYRTTADPGSSNHQVTLCPDGSMLSQFLHCQ